MPELTPVNSSRRSTVARIGRLFSGEERPWVIYRKRTVAKLNYSRGGPMDKRRPIPAIAAPTLFIVAWMIAAHAFAGQDRWTGNGPEGGVILVLVISPSDPAALYAAPYGGGIYRSRDAGETWKAA